MNLKITALFLLAFAGQAIRVSAVACSQDGDCQKTDFTLAKCEKGQCKCISSHYLPVTEGCAAKLPTPEVKGRVGFSQEAIVGRAIELTCKSEGGMTGVVWYQDGQQVSSHFSYRFRMPGRNIKIQCLVQSDPDTPNLNSDLSKPYHLKVLKNGAKAQSEPDLSIGEDAQKGVAAKLYFPVSCYGGPQGLQPKEIIVKSDGSEMQGRDVDVRQLDVITGKQITCEFKVKDMDITFSKTAAINYPPIATTIQSAEVYWSQKCKNQHVYHRIYAPALECKTKPAARYLDRNPEVFSYFWSPGGSTRANWQLSREKDKVYKDIQCKTTFGAKTVQSTAVKTIIVNDLYLHNPKVKATTTTDGRVSLTCSLDKADEGKKVAFEWTKNDYFIPQQRDSTIQFPKKPEGRFRCQITKDCFSSVSETWDGSSGVGGRHDSKVVTKHTDTEASSHRKSKDVSDPKPRTKGGASQAMPSLLLVLCAVQVVVMLLCNF